MYSKNVPSYRDRMSFSGNSLRNAYVLGTGYANALWQIVLFGVTVASYHADYIHSLVSYGCARQLLRQINIIVSAISMQQHSDVVDIALGCDRKTINFLASFYIKNEAVIYSMDCFSQTACIHAVAFWLRT